MDLAPILAGVTALASVSAWRLVTRYDVQLAIMGRNRMGYIEPNTPISNATPAPTAAVRIFRAEGMVFEMDGDDVVRDYNCDKSHLEIFEGDHRPCKHGCHIGLYLDPQGCGVCARCKFHHLDPRTCDHFHRLATQDRYERGAP